jgi:dTMP kinase
MSGVFVSFEGGEGTGKSTQILLLKARLEAVGYRVLTLREPGATAVGEQIRAILLDPSNTLMNPLSELLLYEAARAQLVCEVIRPALAAGMVVLCDRFSDSTLAYQGAARGLGLDFVRRANAVGADGLLPDRTIILSRDIGEGLRKAAEKGPDRLEAEDCDFHERVHAAFLAIAKSEPERVRLVSIAADKPTTAAAVFAQLADLFPAAAARPFDISDELIALVKQQRTGRAGGQSDSSDVVASDAAASDAAAPDVTASDAAVEVTASALDAAASIGRSQA